MNKKGIINIRFLMILVGILILYFIYYQALGTGSVFNDPRSVSTSLISQGQDSYTYSLSFTGMAVNSNYGWSNQPIPFEFSVASQSNVGFSSDIQKDKEFNASSVSVQGWVIGGGLDSNGNPAQYLATQDYRIDDLKAKCLAQSNQLICRFSGFVTPTGNHYIQINGASDSGGSPLSGSAVVTIYKQGYPLSSSSGTGSKPNDGSSNSPATTSSGFSIYNIPILGDLIKWIQGLFR